MENHDQSNEVIKKRNRCHVCNKRVGLVPFLCRCGESFCGLHRMPEKHACKFDFKDGRICLNFIFLIPRSGGIRITKANLEKYVLTWSPKAKPCALLRKKFKEDLFTYCIENGILQDSFEPSNENTNVVNALQEPFVVKQDPGKNSSQSHPQINHNCCYECGDPLEDIFFHQCTCELCGRGAHYGYNCPLKVLVVPDLEPFNNQTVDELPQTLPRFDPKCYSEDENSFTYDPTSNFVHDSPNIFSPPLQPPIYSYEFCGNNAYYGHNFSLQVPFTYDPGPLTPSLSTEEPDNSLSMGNEFIKSSVGNLVPTLSESEGIPDNMCDVPFHDNSPPLDVSKDQLEDFFDSNNESTLTDDDSFSINNIEYIEASPLDYELVSSDVMEIVIPKVGGIDDDILLTIKDDILHEKLLNINLLIANIEALNNNPTPSSDLLTKSSSTSLNSLLEETNTFDNSLPKFKTFCFDLEEISSGSTTTHFDSSLYDSFIFDLSINPFPPVDRSDFYEFADEIFHIISPLEYDCFCFKIEPNSQDFTMDVVGDIFPTREPRVHNAFPTHHNLQLNMDFILSSESLFAYVVWIFLLFLSYSVAPQFLLSFGNEDTIFDPGIYSYHISSFMPDVSDRSGTFIKFKVLNEKIEIPFRFTLQNSFPTSIRLSRLRLVGTRPGKGEVNAAEDLFLIDETAQDQGRINDQDMFGVHDLDGDEVFVDVTTSENVEQGATIAESVEGIVTATTLQISKDELTLAQTLMEIKAAKPKAKGVTIQEPKRIAREKDEANRAVIEEWDNVQAIIDVDRQLAEQIQAQEREQLSIKERSKLLAKIIESRRKYFATKRAKEIRNKLHTKVQ
uniref:Zinc finger A20 and AN1 domain-containing stress-associated protein 4 n=1 Tax=Tanacetum cinerariifolium TaxID=118510 RepID=A0A699H4N5_TANCI|nr:zinc finger A20 and AN1 domain-containing stress-associated protein 4 [Tanacetum cinerariifolium]